MPRFPAVPFGLVLMSAAAFGAQAEVKDAGAAGFTVENAVVVAADADTTWRALVGDVDRWWPKDHSWWGNESKLSIEPRAGGCFCEIAPDGRQAQHLHVVYVEPGRTLRLTGGLGPLQGMGLHGVLEFQLAAAERGTRVSMRYRAGGYTPDGVERLAAVVDRVQAMQLGGLAKYLDARSPQR
ncbi:MAG TPA: SRPBCC domain-containing protein [Lysobacter sp.]|nr:SRPBCC domain-containing protein [Lysobacter sp.]